ncbi:carbon starvation protein A [Megasphaera paucivorans]|uniref:Carbon starvation protein n=1 Tax=Megasphaera paucivorans TaxID=349095 RepID=A0A1H0ATQ5_9FIRM|nr:carbon starvation protein A [Megasphaera paucivorans]SDN36739.1 carbon starvation protein [Megasphaera paucivorans]
MVMNGVYMVIITACFLVLGYRFYGSFIAAKVLTLNQYKVVPSIRLDDGHDYVPTNKWVVFGHHFAAIAGAGPLVGPVIAAQFGYLPGMLWILFGSVFAGAVHDMVILLASVRHDGKSIAEIAKDEISNTAGMSALLATLFLLIITEAGMAVVVANSLFNSPWGTFTVASTIPIAIFVGLYLKYLRPGKIQEATIIGVVLVLLAVFYGSEIPGSVLAPYFTFNLTQLEIMLAVYGFIASVLPVWLLLAPRDYLSTYMKIGTIAALAIGILIVAPTIRMPALTEFCAGGGPVIKGSVIPFVFITIACGAISGFHSLISTGTTPKMLTNERQILPIGYGAMLTESFISMMALIAATSLHPSDYFAINSTQSAFAALGIQVQDLPSLAEQVGENLMHRPGGAVSLAVGMADIFNKIPGMEQFMGFWYHFCIMFEALFILTLIDAGSRVGRYLLQELIGKFSPKFGDTEWWPGIIICSAAISICWGYLVLQGNIGVIWPLFGVSNQLLAAVTLAIGTSFIYRHGRGRYAWVTMIPCIIMSLITVDADYENIFYNYIPAGKWLLVTISVIMLILDAIVMIEAVKSWIRYSKTVPQDMRSREEIEAETKAKNEKEGIEAPAMH